MPRLGLANQKSYPTAFGTMRICTGDNPFEARRAASHRLLIM